VSTGIPAVQHLPGNFDRQVPSHVSFVASLPIAIGLYGLQHCKAKLRQKWVAEACISTNRTSSSSVPLPLEKPTLHRHYRLATEQTFATFCLLSKKRSPSIEARLVFSLPRFISYSILSSRPPRQPLDTKSLVRGGVDHSLSPHFNEEIGVAAK